MSVTNHASHAAESKVSGLTWRERLLAWLPLAAALAVMLLAVGLARYLDALEHARLERLTNQTADGVRQGLEAYMQTRLGGIERIDQRLTTAAPEERKNLFALESRLTLRSPGMRFMAWDDADGARVGEASAGPEFDASAFAAAHEALLREMANAAARDDAVRISAPLDLPDGNGAVVVSVPLKREGRSVGVAHHLLTYRELLNTPMELTGYGHAIVVSDQQRTVVARGTMPAPGESTVAADAEAEIFGRTWHVHLVPTPERLAIYASHLPLAVAVAGAAFALLLALALRYAAQARAQAAQRLAALDALRTHDVELAHVRHALEARNRELQDFLLAASHGLKEPLGTIESFGERLRAQLPAGADVRARDSAARMSQAAGRMRRLVEDLLDFAALSSRELKVTRVELPLLVADLLVDLESAIAASGAEVSQRGLPVVSANPGMMRQLFQNLLSNALKFRVPERKPRIELDASEFQRQRKTWYRITVRDNGIGFEERQRERIFAPFQRLHPERFDGIGIGLAIARNIVERHGGTIFASASPGAGAAFIIELPAEAPPAPSESGLAQA